MKCLWLFKIFTPILIFLEVGYGKTKPNRWLERFPRVINLHRCYCLQNFSLYEKTTKTHRLGSKGHPSPFLFPSVSWSIRKSLFLVFILSLAIKNRYFCQPDGVSITLHESDMVTEETYIYSSLFTVKVHKRFTYWRRKSSVCLLLLLCGDIEMCPGH